MSEDTSPFHPVCGPGAACSNSFVPASHGWSGPAPSIMVGLGLGCGPHPSSGIAVYRCAGVSGARLVAPHRAHLRAHPSPTMRASHAVMEPRPMIHGWKRASCRCFEKPPSRSRYGWGPSCGGHSRVPFTTRREATKSLPGRGGGGGHTYDFSSCFFSKFKKSTKSGFSREMTYFIWVPWPQNRGGGVLLPRFCPKISKTLKCGLFWGIFACSGLVLQNSAAHQCTCL